MKRVTTDPLPSMTIHPITGQRCFLVLEDDYAAMREAADHIDEAHKLLRDCEWANQTPTDRACPVCFHSVTKGHTDTCRLKLFLEAHK